MLTREQILTVPAEQLAEVSARMMGLTIVSSLRACVVKHPEDKNLTVIWKPHTDHNDARWVADWVVNWMPLIRTSIGSAKAMNYVIESTLADIRRGHAPAPVHCWDYTPEQLTRAILLAFVDNGGEI